MVSAVVELDVAAALDGLNAALDVLLADDWVPADVDEAAVRVREVEAVSRRVHALTVGVQERIGRSGVHRADGHGSGKVMVRHVANLSPAMAARRERVVRMGRDLPLVAAGHEAGTIGTPQVERIARVHANPRVREQLVEIDGQLALVAARLTFRELDAVLTDWERLADEDGAGDRAAADHAGRNLSMSREFDGGRRLRGSCGSVDGQIVADIWERQVQREFEADWAEATARVGDGVSVSDLARNDAQRRFDAFKALVVQGDGVVSGGAARTCTDLVVDQVTYERQVAKLCGTDPGPDPRLDTWWDDLIRSTDANPDANLGPDPDPVADPDDHPGGCPADGSSLVGFRCGTIDGRPLDPAEVVVASFVGQVRRVVVGADSVVLDMGRRERCFTGARQLAVRLSNATCVWPGCEVPASQCQCDHLDAFNGPRKGRTCPDNGAPMCGRHNRRKEHGFTIRRDQRGHWHVHRPDGTELT